MRLILVRHGETPWNAVGRIQGKTDIVLSKKGITQAKQIAKMLSAEKPAIIFSSKLKRAIKTAQIIAKKHRQKAEKRKELNEINYGMFEGKTFAQIGKDPFLNGLWEKRRKNKYDFKPQNGESFREMNEKRVKPFVKKILAKYAGKTVIVVAHTGTNRLIAGNTLSLKQKEMLDIWQPNDCVYFIDCGEKKCFYSHKKIGSEKPKRGYLTIRDTKKWEELFK